MYILRFDGLYKKISGGHSTAQAGFMCYGWLIFKDGVLVARGHGGFAHNKDASSSMAEYLAMIEGLEALSDMGVYREPVTVMGDAKSIIEQMSGLAAVNSVSTRPLYKKALQLVRSFQDLNWRWTPRQFNRAADRLTHRAMNQIRANHNEYQAALASLRPRYTRQIGKTKMRSLMDFRVYLSK
jgi:ribonuclease HI